MEKLKELEEEICSWQDFGDKDVHLSTLPCIRDNSRICTYLPKGIDERKGELLTYACKEIHRNNLNYNSD